VDTALLAIATDGDGVTLRVRVTPRARREGILGLHEGALRVAVRAPADRGKANRALVDFLAARLEVARTAIAIERGTASRDKTLRIGGLDAAALRAKLAGPG
jgi:uncharacterized protein